MKVKKAIEYNVPDFPSTCAYLVDECIRECPALKKSIWVDGTTCTTEDVFYCKAFDEQIMKTIEVDKYTFPLKLDACVNHKESLIKDEFPCDYCEYPSVCKNDYECAEVKKFREKNLFSLRGRPTIVRLAENEGEEKEYLAKEGD